MPDRPSPPVQCSSTWSPARSRWSSEGGELAHLVGRGHALVDDRELVVIEPRLAAGLRQPLDAVVLQLGVDEACRSLERALAIAPAKYQPKIRALLDRLGKKSEFSDEGFLSR